MQEELDKKYNLKNAKELAMFYVIEKQSKARANTTGNRVTKVTFDVGTQYNGKKIYIAYKDNEIKYYEGTVGNGQVSFNVDNITGGVIKIADNNNTEVEKFNYGKKNE